MAVSRYSPGRIVLVTLGLALAGAIFGGLAGALTLATTFLFSTRDSLFDRPILLLVAATIGAMLGAGCAPLAGWLLLRTVPLGPAFAWLTVGTTIGGAVGWFVPASMRKGDRSMVAGAIGFLCAALILRIIYARRGSHGVQRPE